MGQDEGCIRGKGAKYLSRGAVVERVEAAAQGFAVERDAALAGLAGCMRLAGMAAERRFHLEGVQTLEDVADCGVRRRAPPCQPEGLVQFGAVDVDKGDNATVRVGAANDGENGEQQDVGQLVEFALGAPGIGNVGQQVQQRRERDHGNLRLGCFARSQTLAVSGIPIDVSPFASPLNCGRSDSPSGSPER